MIAQLLEVVEKLRNIGEDNFFDQDLMCQLIEIILTKDKKGLLISKEYRTNFLELKEFSNSSVFDQFAREYVKQISRKILVDIG